MLANIRLWTATLLIAVCAFSVVWGYRIAQFSLAMSVGVGEVQAETLDRRAAIPGVAAVALESQLSKKLDPADLQSGNRQREVLAKILAIRPLASIDWMSLAAMQLLTDQPMEQVLGALMLSTVTGPNEGYVMADRGMFSVSLWEDLSPDLRRHVATDLALGEMPDNAKFRAILAAKSAAVQDELRKAMLATGLSPKEVERRLGL
jgi:hypothetical protein